MTLWLEEYDREGDRVGEGDGPHHCSLVGCCSDFGIFSEFNRIANFE